MDTIIVLSTTDTLESAEAIASALVDAREAACVNIVPEIRSVYRWEGKVCSESECLLVIKSSSEKFAAIQKRIRSLHNYQVPEIIAVPVSEGDSEYLKWLQDSLREGE